MKPPPSARAHLEVRLGRQGRHDAALRRRPDPHGIARHGAARKASRATRRTARITRKAGSACWPGSPGTSSASGPTRSGRTARGLIGGTCFVLTKYPFAGRYHRPCPLQTFGRYSGTTHRSTLPVTRTTSGTPRRPNSSPSCADSGILAHPSTRPAACHAPPTGNRPPSRRCRHRPSPAQLLDRMVKLGAWGRARSTAPTFTAAAGRCSSRKRAPRRAGSHFRSSDAGRRSACPRQARPCSGGAEPWREWRCWRGPRGKSTGRRGQQP